MEYFLNHISRALFNEFGNTLNRHCLVFPSRRAGLYFMKYLSSHIEKPVWSPAIYTINELFRSYSGLRIASNEILLFELYKSYRQLNKSPESFDDFYFWGDMLLDDFDDADKYMADAKMLFSNISDIRDIDQKFGGLDEERIEIIRKFWVNFNPGKPTREKTEFKSIWSVLFELYCDFRQALVAQNLAYEGMLFRELAERVISGNSFESRWDMVHFIGFNALNECEKVIMKKLRGDGRARFYWDYDSSYTGEGNINSAGYFLRANLKLFGNDMPEEWQYDTLLSVKKDGIRRRVIETSSDTAQVKLITRLVGELTDLTPETAHHTAIVLADENLLIPLLTSLPEDTGEVNITMGYPLRLTNVYTFVHQLMELQRNAIVRNDNVFFTYRDVAGLLKNTLFPFGGEETQTDILGEITKDNLYWVPAGRMAFSDDLKRVFSFPETNSALSGYLKSILSSLMSVNDSSEEPANITKGEAALRNEFIYRIILSINRLESIISSNEVVFSKPTYIRILERILRMQTIPFSGEPLAGIQVMGILETRALDFQNLIILSVNEGIMPAISSGSSFIPFALREAFGLPSINHQESIYAYHFYRLLHRAENVTFIYNSNSEGLRSGEMSRFLLQMRYDPHLKPEFHNMGFEIKSHRSAAEVIERDDGIQKRLISRFLAREGSGIISPSAINTWLNCRMKFYYRYVNGLKEPEKVSQEIDPAMLGEILHAVMKNLYTEFVNRTITSDTLKALSSDRKHLVEITQRHIREAFKRESPGIPDGKESIVRDVLLEYIQRIIEADRLAAPIRILYLEDHFTFPLKITSGGGVVELMAGGTIDRVDEAEGLTRIVDYKTGTVADRLNSTDDLFIDDRKKEYDGWLQTLMYCEAFISSFPDKSVIPSICQVKKPGRSEGNDRLRIRGEGKNYLEVTAYQMVRQDFISGLRRVIEEIFDAREQFRMTSDSRGKCSYCPYRALCTR